MKPIADILAAIEALPDDWHGAGCLEMPNLEAMARLASSRKIKRSVETGTGKSTLLLSHLSEHHLCFSLDDAKSSHSLQQAASSDVLKSDAVEFVVGPSQSTLLAHTFTEPLQLAFIDGPHGYPFPDLEYWKLYPHIEPGGLLIVDDVHIPTIRNLFDFLCEDEMWTLLETVGKTAFFERTTAKTLSPFGDGWWEQKYNTHRFPMPNPGDVDRVSLGVGQKEDSAGVYRRRLLPLVEQWTTNKQRVAIFGTGGHTDFLWQAVPELWRLDIVAYLDSNKKVQGTTYRNVAVQPLEWATGQVDVVLCSSYEHELTQLALLDTLPVKVVLSHPVTPAHGALAAAAVAKARAA